MNFKGSIILNDSHESGVPELLKAILNQLTGNPIKLAIWLIEDIDLFKLNPQVIQTNSPFEGSDSILAGSGVLISIEPQNLENVIHLLTTKDYLYHEILHLEIEVNGLVQFVAYDHFEAILFGEDVSLNLLEHLKSREVINRYELLSSS
ncbi:MAG: hypothetical protein SWJ54_14545 [Cyanobacteriota bacterium]|nr:hypothetical protein [Cyanobacteriota bacterium]